MTPQQIQFIQENKDTMSITEIAKAIGSGKTATYRHFKKIGYKGYKPKLPLQLTDEQIAFLEQHASEGGIRALVGAYGLTTWEIIKYRRENNITGRPKVIRRNVEKASVSAVIDKPPEHHEWNKHEVKNGYLNVEARDNWLV